MVRVPMSIPTRVCMRQCLGSRASELTAAGARRVRALIPAHEAGGDAFADFGLGRLKVS